jgi:hypothetical protein
MNELNTNSAGVAAVQAPAIISLSNFSRFKQYFTTLYEGFNESVINDQWNARNIRRLEVSVDSLQQSGKLEADETYIPVRIIDRNVKARMPSRLAYLKSANRLAIFEAQFSLEAIDIQPNTSRLESEFWRVLTYDNWETSYIASSDGAEFVGWNWLEVLYTPTEGYEGHCGIFQVGRENLIFDTGVDDIQKSKIVVKRIPITLVTLAEYAKVFAFKPAFVAKLMEQVNLVDTNSGPGSASYDNADDSCIYIFRAFWKEGGVVKTAFYADDLEDWLNDPHDFYNGVDKEVEQAPVVQPGSLVPEATKVWQKEPSREYPFVPVLRSITEDLRIAQTQGSVSADYGIQEAACSVFSALVNMGNRHAQTMWSPAGDNYDKTGAPKQLSMKLERGQIWDRPMAAFSTPPPDSTLPNIIQALEQCNAQNNQQIAWAVNNRKDSRKTATEVGEAARTQSEINSSETFMFSMCLRQAWSMAWPIIQSQALQGLIVFCPMPDGTNDVELIRKSYKLKAAGDTDYVEKQKTIVNMQQDMPTMLPTPAGPMFLTHYLRLRYPAEADTYIKALDAQRAQEEQQKNALLKTAVTDPHTGELEPEFQPYQAQIAQMLAPKQAGAKTSQQQPQQSPPQQQAA